MRTTLLALALGIGCAAGAFAQSPKREPILFPDLEFEGQEGGSVRLSDLKGNVVLVNVWATWCGPCKMELPVVQKLYDNYSDRNFVVVSVNVDRDRNRLPQFMKQLNISLPIYFAGPEDSGQLTAYGIPSSYLLATYRTLLDQQVGYAPAVEDRWKKLLEKNLRAKK